MDEELRNGEAESTDSDNGYRKGNGKWIFIFALLIVIIAMSMWFMNKYGIGFTGEKEENISVEINYEVSSKADFYTYDKNIYYCTKDGMQLLNSKGETKWTDTYTMISPYMNCDGAVVAAADENGRSIRIYNQDGKLYGVDTEQPIISFAVNANGYGAVMVQGESEYQLNIYNNLGEVISTGKYPANEGMPISVDISDDNRIFAVSFVDITDIKMKSNVLFYYTQKEEANTADSGDGMFASFMRDDQIIAVVRFMENNNLIAVSDSEIVCVKVGDNSRLYEEKWAIELKNKLNAIDFVGNKYMAVAYGEEYINADTPEKENTVKWYSLTGSKVNEYTAPKKVTALHTCNDTTVVAMDRSFAGVSTKGNAVWEYNATQDVNKIISYDGGNKVIFAAPNKMNVMTIGRGGNIDNQEAEDIGNDAGEIVVPNEEDTETVSGNRSEETTAQEVTIEETTIEETTAIEDMETKEEVTE